ncbi:Putative protein kinase-like domain superfamily [Colletotrichum destructivum]|uniref:DUF7580 domain-containing protein n=1 Tax=Colletotrichum destructivum TaxID=34406 RepID=A0AAX4IDC9_9PEZI|nr:Putative protein kinase-like domain superfamily [Colletotrichum destructivum]
MVFEPPSTHMVSLRSLLVSDHQAQRTRDLDARLGLARQLVASLFRLFEVSWLHKSLWSGNAVFFDPKIAVSQKVSAEAQDVHKIPKPHLLGFDLSRRDASAELTEAVPSSMVEVSRERVRRLCRHPDLSSEARSGFYPHYRRKHDAYSLGIMLLEIGLWCPIDKIASRSREPEVFQREDLREKVRGLRALMGRRYWEVVERCLFIGFGEDELPEMSESQELRNMQEYLSGFDQLVVTELEQMSM